MVSGMRYDTFSVRRVSEVYGREQERRCESSIQGAKNVSNDAFRLIGVPSSTFYMLTYDQLLRIWLPPLSPWPSLTPMFAGITARTFISTVASPLELIRTNLQSTPPSPDNPHTLRSVLSDVRGIAREHGLRALWRGVGPTLWRDVPFSGIYWFGYEEIKRSLASKGYAGAHVAFISGALSGTTAAVVVSPFDTLKTRRQAIVMSAMAGGSSTTTSLIGLCKNIVRTEGVSALYAGLTPRIAKIAPACGIMISCFEVRLINFVIFLPYISHSPLRALANG